MRLVKEIDMQELGQWRADGKDFLLIDVREPMEHDSYNIGGRLLPLGELQRSADSIPSHMPVVFYCKRGIRSMIAIQKLQGKIPGGDFYNLKGGIGTGLNPA